MSNHPQSSKCTQMQFKHSHFIILNSRYNLGDSKTVVSQTEAEMISSQQSSNERLHIVHTYITRKGVQPKGASIPHPGNLDVLMFPDQKTHSRGELQMSSVEGKLCCGIRLFQSFNVIHHKIIRYRRPLAPPEFVFMEIL